MSLDTKYRPYKYSDVLGQKETIKTLKGFIKSDAGWRQSYLFAGPYGSGKTTLGRIMARALLCSSTVDGEPCDECVSCKSMLDGSHDSFIEVDAATNSGKADVKKLLEDLAYTSFSGSKKLYLFDEAHQLSKDALDALLKPMEENDKGSFNKKLVCIFATTEPEKMRQTVLSRCAPAFIIKHVKSDEIADRLAKVCEEESFTYEREALLLIADFTEGHIRDALKAIEGVASSNDGNVGLDGVRAYLHVDRNDQISQLLIEDTPNALGIIDDLLGSSPVGVLYDRLLTATSWAITIGLNAGNPPPFWKKDILEKAWDMHQTNLLVLADALATAPLRPTGAMFKVDFLKWSMYGGQIPQRQESVFVKKDLPVETPKEGNVKENQSMSLSMFASLVKSKLEK
jgi:DNA polymerase III subunit gamma/tau